MRATFWQEMSESAGLKVSTAWAAVCFLVLPLAIAEALGLSEMIASLTVVALTLPVQYVAFLIIRMRMCVAGPKPHAAADENAAIIFMITANELTKRYAHNTAVDHISFQVEKGQIVGFLGPNGAGKTTAMRMLTCFLPPTEGSASVAGFDVLEQPLEVKRRIGYLPETPPLYPEMRTAEYLEFVGKIKGLRGADLAYRVDSVMERCAILDVKDKVLGKLSKGYRQRVGLAQAIIHSPDVLILDEPTAGLDPKQINETRDLIKSLAGDHTIILSTHILPEVEQTCQQVIIINKGKLVATDSVQNLRNRARGTGSVLVKVAARHGALNSETVRQRLEKVTGVTRVLLKETRDGRAIFEVEADSNRAIRGDLARAIVESGWDLDELRTATVSLEAVFLELTNSDKVADPANAPAAEAAAQ